ncbi:MAG: ABC transporter permease [Bacilli bacterium]|nr:ABC transporter permease [Bacilli bacterium]
MGAQLAIFFSYIFIFAVALMIVAIGGMFSERSGIVNIGLEGTMVFGGFFGLLTLTGLYSIGLHPALIVMLTILVAIIAGAAYSLLLATVAIHLNADQTLIGTAMNLLATATVVVLAKRISPYATDTIEFLKDAFIIPLGKFDINIFLFLGIIILIVSWFALFKTRFGLRLRACGENPQSAASAGINVFKFRYIGVIISGALAGLGALAYIIPSSSSWNASSGVAGFGFLALAVLIFGAWKPVRIAGAALFFSFFMALSFCYFDLFYALFGVELSKNVGVTSELFKMIPYILSLVLLAFTSRKSRAPKAEGQPYERGQR